MNTAPKGDREGRGSVGDPLLFTDTLSDREYAEMPAGPYRIGSDRRRNGKDMIKITRASRPR